jgi:hypothetical protein
MSVAAETHPHQSPLSAAAVPVLASRHSGKRFHSRHVRRRLAGGPPSIGRSSLKLIAEAVRSLHHPVGCSPRLHREPQPLFSRPKRHLKCATILPSLDVPMNRARILRQSRFHRDGETVSATHAVNGSVQIAKCSVSNSRNVNLEINHIYLSSTAACSGRRAMRARRSASLPPVKSLMSSAPERSENATASKKIASLAIVTHLERR